MVEIENGDEDTSRWKELQKRSRDILRRILPNYDEREEERDER